MASELFEKRLALTRQLLAVGYGRVYLSELTISELEDLINQDPEEILREEDLKAELEIREQKRGNGREPFIQFDPKIDDTSLVIELEEELD